MKQNEYLFKASWRGTSLLLRVLAANVKQAQAKAEGRVFRMEGGTSCLEVTLIRQTK